MRLRRIDWRPTAVRFGENVVTAFMGDVPVAVVGRALGRKVQFGWIVPLPVAISKRGTMSGTASTEERGREAAEVVIRDWFGQVTGGQ